MSGKRLAWVGNEWRTATKTRVPARLVESFLVDQGMARNLDWHEERFFRAIEAHGRGGSAGVTRDLWSAALQEIPRVGRWFPRVEARRGGAAAEWRFELWVRPAPPLETLISGVATQNDPRLAPGFKGPDIEALAALKNQLGAEPILLTPNGHVIEGSSTSVIWWEKDGSLCASAVSDRVPSTTERALITAAKQAGVEVRWRLVTPEEWHGLEVWAVNALHGLRPLASIEGAVKGELRLGRPRRAKWGRQQLTLQGRPLGSRRYRADPNPV